MGAPLCIGFNLVERLLDYVCGRCNCGGLRLSGLRMETCFQQWLQLRESE